MSQDKPNSQEKLVTVAIHTFEKAQVLQTLLQSEGIEATLQNVNQILPIVSAGVRVRIKESDLPHAIDIIENSNWNRPDLYAELNQVDGYSKEGKHTDAAPYVLIPVDFSDFTPNVLQIGFHFAQRRGLHVKLLHAYFSQFYSIAPMLSPDIAVYQSDKELNVRREFERAQRKMRALEKEISDQIAQGTLPEAPFETELIDGIPEDVVLTKARNCPPVAIIMGTRGKSRRNEDLIGSVAAEVIDRAKVPVLVVPEDTPVVDLADIENVGVATGFDQRDLVLFDRMMQLNKPNQPNYMLFNISRASEDWNEIELRAMMEYHKQHYPDSNIQFSPLDPGDFSLALEKFVLTNKIGLIVINTYRRNLFARLFNPGMARRMLFHAGTPLLVMHSSTWR
ncbi:MAG: universal stress protein [Bacteroidales bacterium]|nr:universal stress protein [Porphyromonas sp.]MDD6935165.1 universal stress protein [Bacteroidales bacterium]MDY3102394.1 universal stress protein [Porphyromonas sp.]